MGNARRVNGAIRDNAIRYDPRPRTRPRQQTSTTLNFLSDLRIFEDTSWTISILRRTRCSFVSAYTSLKLALSSVIGKASTRMPQTMHREATILPAVVPRNDIKATRELRVASPAPHQAQVPRSQAGRSTQAECSLTGNIIAIANRYQGDNTPPEGMDDALKRALVGRHCLTSLVVPNIGVLILETARNLGVVLQSHNGYVTRRVGGCGHHRGIPSSRLPQRSKRTQQQARA